MADIGSLGTVVDGELSRPIFLLASSLGRNIRIQTSAKAFHWSLLSGGRARHCSPMILEISGFASPGFWATTAP